MLNVCFELFMEVSLKLSNSLRSKFAFLSEQQVALVVYKSERLKKLYNIMARLYKTVA